MAKVSRLNRQFDGNADFEASRARAQTYMRIGAELRRMREGMSLTQEDLASKTGLDQSDISKIESGVWGKRGISFDTLNRVLPVFGLRVVHTISPLPGASLNKEERAQAWAMNELMHSEL